MNIELLITIAVKLKILYEYSYLICGLETSADKTETMIEEDCKCY
jgi:hypothetical protein